MKTRILAIAVLLGSFSQLLIAQEKPEPSIVFKVNPLVLFGKKQFYFEMPVNQNSSVELSIASFNSWKNLSLDIDNVYSEEKDLTHWLFIPSYRYYFSGKAPHGAYFGLYGRTKLSSGSVKVEVDAPNLERDFNHYRTATELGAGFIFGKQWVTRQQAVFDLFIGSGTSYRWVSNDYDDPEMTDKIYEQEVLGDRERLDRWLHQLRVGFTVGFQLGGNR